MNILKGKLHRILTQDINRPGILTATNKYFNGYTIRPGIGYWEGQAEDSLTIEVITDNTPDVMKLAKDIKSINKQDAVLVEILINQASLI